MTSPTIVAQFADGVTTRMTCHCLPVHLDLARGIKLSQAAYESRVRKPPPAIVEARFVEAFSDDVIKIFSREELAAAMDAGPADPEMNSQRAAHRAGTASR
jgi:hypothetical protein